MVDMPLFMKVMNIFIIEVLTMTKKEQKKENNKRRNFWGMNPRTRVKNSKKKYNRNREKENLRKFSD